MGGNADGLYLGRDDTHSSAVEHVWAAFKGTKSSSCQGTGIRAVKWTYIIRSIRHSHGSNLPLINHAQLDGFPVEQAIEEISRLIETSESFRRPAHTSMSVISSGGIGLKAGLLSLAREDVPSKKTKLWPGRNGIRKQRPRTRAAVILPVVSIKGAGCAARPVNYLIRGRHLERRPAGIASPFAGLEARWLRRIRDRGHARGCMVHCRCISLSDSARIRCGSAGGRASA